MTAEKDTCQWARGWCLGNVWHRVERVIERSGGPNPSVEVVASCGRYVPYAIVADAPWPDDRRCRACVGVDRRHSPITGRVE
jgi:hypothetical protein